MKQDYSSLFISAALLVAVGLSVDGITTTPTEKFVEGILIGMSIACSLTGFILYARSSKKG